MIDIAQIKHKQAKEIIYAVEFSPNGRIRHDININREAYRKAFLLEREAAKSLNPDTSKEKKSTLLHSASWMAFRATLFKEAIEIANEGLKICSDTKLKSQLLDIIVLSVQNLQK